MAGTFVLQSIDGTPLPAPIFQSGPTTIILLTDTLTLRGDGSGEEVRVQHLESQSASNRVDFPVHYELHGDSIALTHLCPINAICPAVVPPVLPGRLTATGLVVQEETRELVYRRID